MSEREGEKQRECPLSRCMQCWVCRALCHGKHMAGSMYALHRTHAGCLWGLVQAWCTPGVPGCLPSLLSADAIRVSCLRLLSREPAGRTSGLLRVLSVIDSRRSTSREWRLLLASGELFLALLCRSLQQLRS